MSNQVNEDPTLAEVTAMRAAMVQLRGLYPNKYVSVQRKDGMWFHPMAEAGSDYHYFHVIVGTKGWRKPTLEEALALATKP